ncbi:DUF4245 domain-containing protein [Gordonia spumicola]|nr:DUF4245 domain-containing protein [Gordonia spumicola]
MAEKPRILQDGRDMMWSLIPLAVLILIVAGVAGSCSWGFGKDATAQNVPHFDVSGGLHADAATLKFPIRDPKVPADWQPNSGSTQNVEASLSSNVGWITGDGAYVQLTQTDGAEEALMNQLLGDDTSATGTRQIGGRTWVTYENPDHKKAWIADFGDVRIAVKTSGKDSTMQTLAEAVSAAAPIVSTLPKPTG